MKAPVVLFAGAVATAMAIGWLVATGVATRAFAQQPPAGLARQNPQEQPRPAVIAKLEEIVAIRKRLFDSERVLIDAGRAPLDSPREIELVEARLELAREKNDRDNVLVELKNLVAAHQQRLKRLESVSRDRLAPAELDQLKIELLHAEVRLLREER